MPKHALRLPVFVDGSGHRRIAVKLGIRSLAGVLAIGIAALLFSLGVGVPLPGLTHPVHLPPAERPPAQVDDGPQAQVGAPSSSARRGTPQQHAHERAAAPTSAGPSSPAGTTRVPAVIRRPATTAPASQPAATTAASSAAAASSSATPSSPAPTSGTAPASATAHGRAPTAPPGRTHTPGRPSERPTHS